MADKPRVQFVCVRNAGRSQMAAAWLSRLAGDRALHPRRPRRPRPGADHRTSSHYHHNVTAERNTAMSRVQLALNVDNLDEAIKFYSTLFGTHPAKVKPGYANFAITEPPLKLVLLENPGHGGTINHLGVEVESSEMVHQEIGRLTAEGMFTEEEIGTTCCFATQDKVWITGPGGEKWEIYTVLADSDTFGRQTEHPDQTCCAT
jgi:catechol 2,3-dioxygenase-like lactoylglutathione lyase family enzyme